MKKIISVLLLCCILMFSLASCEKESELLISDLESVMENADSDISLSPKDGDPNSYTYSNDSSVNPVTYTVSCDKKGNITYIAINSSGITASMIESSSSIKTIMNKNPGSMTMSQLKTVYLVIRLANLIELVSQEGSSVSYYDTAINMIVNESSMTYGDWTVESDIIDSNVVFTACFSS